MNELYSLGEARSKGTNKYQLEIFLNVNSGIFKGHFPDQPILPGVCLLEMLKDGIEKAVGISVKIKKAANIKYLKMVDPTIDDKLLLDFEISEVEAGHSVVASTSLGDGSVNFKFKGVVT